MWGLLVNLAHLHQIVVENLFLVGAESLHVLVCVQNVHSCHILQHHDGVFHLVKSEKI